MKTFWPLILLASAVLLPAEYVCATSALGTQGEVMQCMLFLLFWCNVAALGLALKFPRTGLGLMLGLALLIIPYQVFLLQRLTWLNVEITRFVDTYWRMRAAGESLPLTLDDYSFNDPLTRKFIYEYSVNQARDEFRISYFVVQPGITHWYDSKTGWGYYPD